MDLRVCECCPTAAAMTSDGPIVAFRNRGPDEMRDIHVARLENGKWTESKAVHNDGGSFPACPVNGPALSARGRDVAVAWYTGVNVEPKSYVAFSSDAGRTLGSPILIDGNGSRGSGLRTQSVFSLAARREYVGPWRDARLRAGGQKTC